MENLDISSQPAEPVHPVDLGTWTGQALAFGLVANRCSAAQAECLKRIRESRAYTTLDLTWEQFCRQRAGISRAQADELIRRLDEFGDHYFQLASISRLSPDAYRLLAPAVSDQGIELDGELVPITVENAPRIRLAIQALRAELKRPRPPGLLPSIIDLQRRFDVWFEEFSMCSRRQLDAGNQAACDGMMHYVVDKMKDFMRKKEGSPR